MGAGCGLWVKLYRKEWLAAMLYAFYGVVVLVFEPDFPAFWESFFIDGESVVLGGDVATVGFCVGARLVLGAVAVFEFVSFCAGGDSHDLAA